MAMIYKKNNDIVIKNIDLPKITMQCLELGEVFQIDVFLKSEKDITDQQRKCIFAICKDIELHTGHDKELTRRTVMSKCKVSSLSTADRLQAQRIITELIDFIIFNSIPIKLETRENEAFKFLPYQTMMLVLQRQCVICGKPKSDIHHIDKVGIGRNRNTINHVGMQVVPLCREHHNEAHNIGDKAFEQKYHISACRVDERLNKFIKNGTLTFHLEDLEEVNEDG